RLRARERYGGTFMTATACPMRASCSSASPPSALLEEPCPAARLLFLCAPLFYGRRFPWKRTNLAKTASPSLRQNSSPKSLIGSREKSRDASERNRDVPIRLVRIKPAPN